MQIRMNTTIAGPSGTATPGQVIDRPEDEARALIAGGYASAIEIPATTGPGEQTADATPTEDDETDEARESGDLESATTEPGEQATTRRSRKARA